MATGSRLMAKPQLARGPSTWMCRGAIKPGSVGPSICATNRFLHLSVCIGGACLVHTVGSTRPQLLLEASGPACTSLLHVSDLIRSIRTRDYLKACICSYSMSYTFHTLLALDLGECTSIPLGRRWCSHVLRGQDESLAP